MGTRLIPAHAGKTDGRVSIHLRLAAHPRSRGENTHTMREMTNELGSSPLTRGKHRRSQSIRNRVGLIPAHAGKTMSALASSTWPRAHPRSRGENVCPWLEKPATWGSSPLTRGKPCSSSPPVPGCGLIPAHAGKTFERSDHPRTHRAHPRSRGENSCVASSSRACRGSSPLTRGKPWRLGRVG